MGNDTTLLLDLDGVSVARVERLADGRRRVHLVTADETARACPACGVFATRVKGSAVIRPRDLPYGESGLEFHWHKGRWWRREAGVFAAPARAVGIRAWSVAPGVRQHRHVPAHRTRSDQLPQQCGHVLGPAGVEPIEPGEWARLRTSVVFPTAGGVPGSWYTPG